MFRILSIALAALFAASCIIAIPVNRTIPQLEADLRHIDAQLTKIDAAVKAFPNVGGTMANALAIHKDFLAYATHMDTMNGHLATAGHLPEADARTVLSHIYDLLPVFHDCFAQVLIYVSNHWHLLFRSRLWRRKPLSTTGNIPTLVKADITRMGTTGHVLGQSLIQNVPSDLVHAATDILTNFHTEFSIAFDAYANV